MAGYIQPQNVIGREYSRERRTTLSLLNSGHAQSRFLFYALLTAIAVHIDTWYRQDKEKKESP